MIKYKTQGTFVATGSSTTVDRPLGLDTNNVDDTHGLSISGTFVATVALERSHDGGVSWDVLASYTAPTQKSVKANTSYFKHRLTCSSWTSGTVSYFLG